MMSAVKVNAMQVAWIALCYLLVVQNKANGTNVEGSNTGHLCRNPDNLLDTLPSEMSGLYTNDAMFNASFPLNVNDNDIETFSKTSIQIFKQICSMEPMQFLRILKIVLGDNKHAISEALEGSTNTRSTCPWMFTTNSDPDRFPQYIPEAACVCDNCVYTPRVSGIKRHGSKGRNNKLHRPMMENNLPSSTGKCKQLKAPVVVFRKRCNMDTGLYEYKIDTESIAFGCKCGSQ